MQAVPEIIIKNSISILLHFVIKLDKDMKLKKKVNLIFVHKCENPKKYIKQQYRVIDR